MKEKEIRALFLQADEQIPMKEIRKCETYEILVEEMNQQKSPVISKKYLLLSQFWYMDKTFFVLYGALICLGLLTIAALEYLGAGEKEIMTVCMAGAGSLSTMSILVINKLFFGKMAEMGASCYFHTKQCVAAHLIATGMVNLFILMFMALYLETFLDISWLQVGLYILTPYLVSSTMTLGILSTETGDKIPYFLCVSMFFLAMGSAVIGAVPEMFLVSSLWIWGFVFVITGILLIRQVKRLFRQMEKGEVLCMN